MSTFTDLELVTTSFGDDEGGIVQFWCDPSFWCDPTFWCLGGGTVFNNDTGISITFTDLELV